MNPKIIILKVCEPEKSNSSNGNYAIAIDFQYIDGFKANTWLFTYGKQTATELYINTVKKLGKIIDFTELKN